MLTGTNQQRLADMQEALPDAQVLRNDASDPSAANALADSVAAGGGLDGLWLNAGYAAVAGADEVDADYITREGLARAIAGEFWSKIEKIAPDQRTLNIPQEVYDQWREGIRLRPGVRFPHGPHLAIHLYTQCTQSVRPIAPGQGPGRCAT